MKRILIISLIMLLIIPSASFAETGTLTAKPVIECCDKYKDLELDAWYHEAVHFCLMNEFMNGKGDNLFKPEANITRAELITILWKMAGCPKAKTDVSFSDLPKEKWCCEQVTWAVENQIADVYENGVHPDRAITREEFSLFIYNYAKTLGEGFTGSWNFLLPYDDRDSIHSWADEAVHWCCKKGIVSGKENNLFDPSGLTTRAQAASMIMRFCRREK